LFEFGVRAGEKRRQEPYEWPEKHSPGRSPFMTNASKKLSAKRI
jgi:hypothetical protein